MDNTRHFIFIDGENGGDGERQTSPITFTFYEDGTMTLNDRPVQRVEYVPGFKNNKVYSGYLNIHYDRTENCGWGGTFSRSQSIRVDTEGAFNELKSDKYEARDNIPFDEVEAILTKLNWLEDNNYILHFKPEELKLEDEGIWHRPYNLGELSYLGQTEPDYFYKISFDQVNHELVYADSRGEKRKKLADGQHFISLENIAALVDEWGIINNAFNVFDLTESIAAILLAWHYLRNYYHDSADYQIARWFDRQMVIYDGSHAVQYALWALANEKIQRNAKISGYNGKGEWQHGAVIDMYFDYWDMERADDPIKDAALKHVKETW